jgi:hypothetical protein
MFIFMCTCDKFMVYTFIFRICFLTQQPNLGRIDIDSLSVSNGFLVHFNQYKFLSRFMFIFFINFLDPTLVS